MVYEQYEWKPEYEGLPLTYGGFGIVQGLIEGRRAVCIKQRNGKGSSPYLFDLPGGGMNDATDPDLRSAALRETVEEIRVRGTIIGAIGQPLYLPIKKDGVLIRVDCAQAFLMSTFDTPKPGEEALAVAFVHEKSFAGFNVVSRKADPQSPVFGRTPIMIFDGLSVIQTPFYRGPLTDDIRSSIVGESDTDEERHRGDFMLMDGGHYFGQTFPSSVGMQVDLYRRLNPDQPDGYFRGALEHLAQQRG